MEASTELEADISHFEGLHYLNDGIFSLLNSLYNQVQLICYLIFVTKAFVHNRYMQRYDSDVF